MTFGPLRWAGDPQALQQPQWRQRELVPREAWGSSRESDVRGRLLLLLPGGGGGLGRLGANRDRVQSRVRLHSHTRVHRQPRRRSQEFTWACALAHTHMLTQPHTRVRTGAHGYTHSVG